jgi:hypothetical protein
MGQNLEEHKQLGLLAISFGWWFGTFFHILGIITPPVFHMFQDG